MRRSLVMLAWALAACVDPTKTMLGSRGDAGAASGDGSIEVRPHILDYRCTSTALAADDEPVAIDIIPAAQGRTDVLAILSVNFDRTRLTVLDPTQPESAVTRDYPGEVGRALHGYFVSGGRPALAVATSEMQGTREALIVRVYDWSGGELVDHAQPISGDCGQWTCGTQPPDCRIGFGFQTRVTITDADLDDDFEADLLVASSETLPIVTYFSSGSCSCARYAQAPSPFEVLSLGGEDGSTDPKDSDVVIGAPGGLFVRYDRSCGQPSRFGPLAPVRDLARARFQEVYEDLVVVSATSFVGGSFDDPGEVRVLFGGPVDLTQSSDESLLFAEKDGLRDPRGIAVGDLDGDQHQDFAVLYGAGGARVWLGNGQRAFAEDLGPELENCVPLGQLWMADFDGDGQKELVAICSPTSAPLIERCVPEL